MNWRRVKNVGRAGYFDVAEITLGWLVSYVSDASTIMPGHPENPLWGYEWRPALTFIPDPEHESKWDWESPDSVKDQK